MYDYVRRIALREYNKDDYPREILRAGQLVHECCSSCLRHHPESRATSGHIREGVAFSAPTLSEQSFYCWWHISLLKNSADAGQSTVTSYELIPASSTRLEAHDKDIIGV